MWDTRSRWDIMADVLRVSAMGEKKTHIMYKCNLSVRQLRNYMVLLLSKGFLQNEDGSPFYATTSKGHAFLKAYNKMLELDGGNSKDQTPQQNVFTLPE